MQGNKDSTAHVDTMAASASGATGSGADEAAAAIGGAGGTFSFVDLSISAAGLIALDATSASDPICVVYENSQRGLVELGRTEVICTFTPLLHARLAGITLGGDVCGWLGGGWDGRLCTFGVEQSVDCLSASSRKSQVLRRVVCVRAVSAHHAGPLCRPSHHLVLGVWYDGVGVVAANSNSPKFVTLVRVKYRFEEQQSLVFRLYDVDTEVGFHTHARVIRCPPPPSPPLPPHDPLGCPLPL